MKKGFTLVELLVVIAILGMIMAVFFPNFLGARQRARDSKRKSDLGQIQNAMELYKLDQNPPAYPTGPFESGACNACWSSGGFASADSCIGTIYMKKFPCDPGSSNTPYILKTDDADSLKYSLIACLENGADQDRDSTTASECTTGASYTIGDQ